MAAIDFPASPALDQVFNAPNGASYQWNGTLWVPIGISGALTTSDTPPSSPGAGQLWWNSALGQLFIWYNDGTSSQWVPANPVPVGLGGGLVREVIVTTAQPTIDLFSLGVKSVQVMFKVNLASAGASLYMRSATGSTPLTSATYSSMHMLNHHEAVPPSGTLYLSGGTSFNIAQIANTGIISGHIIIPDIQMKRANGQTTYNQNGGQWTNLASSYFNDSANGNGLQFFASTGNFAVGSFVRVIGWP